MPPPLPSQQGSRAGLITTLVIFIILFLVSTIFWITTSQKLTKAEQTVKSTQDRYKEVISDEELSAPAYQDAVKAKSVAGSSAFQAVVKQRDELAQTIAGQPVPSGAARQ